MIGKKNRMYIHRNIDADLIAWANSKRHKPLLLRTMVTGRKTC